MKHDSSFVAITTEGGLLPADFLAELLSPKAEIEGLSPTSYNLAEGERINEQVNRSWNRLKGRWTDFQRAIADKSVGETTTTETRDRWLQPLFQELGYGQRLERLKPIEVDGKTYAVSHGWTHVPIHLVGSHLDLDHRTPGAVGAAKASPHSLVQQVLNASDEHLWGIVSNGLTFRLLRDNIALTRLSYVEWDLAGIFEGDLYSEFFLLWLVVHQSRFDADRPEHCWLEQWKKIAEDKGLRALEKLRPGVARAIEALGAGLVSHPANKALREKLSSGTLTTQDFYRQVLRVIYRMLFLFVAEERDLLHQPLPRSDGPKDVIDQALRARTRYDDFYSITRLRELTLHRAGTPHPDLWQLLQLITQKLGSDTGCHELALPPLGSFLWDAARSTPDLNDALVSNRNFLTAIHALAFVQDGSIRRSVDYKNLGSEELGSVYEGLLELHPVINADTGAFELNIAAGSERKTSGSYYTPDSLVQRLLDSALEPVIAEAVRGKQGRAALDALLKLKLCDPAVGSGHFLIAAAHRLAKHVAAVRSGEDEPGPQVTRSALRDVIGRCLYGVDINPMAAELCRVNLWLEALEPGKPLSFLDHHIRVGNSLLGATPDLISNGIPDEAFKAIEGDDKKACSALKKLNARERRGFGELFVEEDNTIRERLRRAAAALDDIGDDRLAEIHRKEAAFLATQGTDDFRRAKDLGNLWCAAFVIKKRVIGLPMPLNDEQPAPALEPDTNTVQAGLFGAEKEVGRVKAKTTVQSKSIENKGLTSLVGITTEHLRRVAKGAAIPEDLLREAEHLAGRYGFFHWHLSYPEVFANGGFDLILGNPPWEGSDLMKVEFFATLLPEVAGARTTEDRLNIMDDAIANDPGLDAMWNNALRENIAQSHFTRASGRYPLTSGGKLNTYRTFAELSVGLLNSLGRVGMVLKSGIINAQDNQEFFASLLREARVVAAYDFINTKGLFRSVVANERFCLLTVTGPAGGIGEASFMFCLDEVEQLSNGERRIAFKRDELVALNPNDLSVPPLTSASDKELLVLIHRRIPVLVNESQQNNRLHVRYSRGHLNSSTDSDLFSKNYFEALTTVGLVDESGRWNSDEVCPLIEGKLIGMWNHRFGTFLGVPWASRFGKKAEARQPSPEQLRDPNFRAVPRFWLRSSDAHSLFTAKNYGTNWLFTYRHVCRAIVDARTAQVCISPNEPTSDSCALLLFDNSPTKAATAGCLLVAAWTSFVGDYVLRQKIYGPALTKAIAYQLPSPCLRTIEGLKLGCVDTAFIKPRVLELTYTAWDLQPFAQDCGWLDPPLRWDEERRFLLRCELDAAFFHLYLGSETEWRQQPAALTQSFPTPRDAVHYIMDTFPIVKRKDEAKFNGDYRTKRVILEMYDEMAQAMATNQPYETRLNPPPADPTCCHPKKKLGILAFGSLIKDPGAEIRNKIIMRIKTSTPFSVEFGRYSGKTRGGAPTLVPHEAGAPVSAEILVLDDSVTFEEAQDMLWRRETRKVESDEKYVEGTLKNSVLVKEFTESPGVASVLYTDFRPEGKIAAPTAAELAQQAIESVSKAEQGMDGITYLMNAMAAGIKTPLTQSYYDEILRHSETNSLREALEQQKAQKVTSS